MNSLRAAHRNGEPREDIRGSHPLAVLGAQRLLVELADTRLSERLDERIFRGTANFEITPLSLKAIT